MEFQAAINEKVKVAEDERTNSANLLRYDRRLLQFFQFAYQFC